MAIKKNKKTKMTTLRWTDRNATKERDYAYHVAKISRRGIEDTIIGFIAERMAGESDVNQRGKSVDVTNIN